MPHDRIADALQAHAPAVRRRAVEAMYADPFWDARFGASGRRHADEDGDFHLGYLAEALRLGSAATFASYAQWLRSVLVARGMCTRHQSQQLGCVADAVEALGLLPAADDARVVREYVAAARDALHYPAGTPAGAIQDVAPRAADRVEAALVARFGDANGSLPPRRRLCDDATDLLSFLADAVAASRADLFIAHTRWLDDFFAAQGRPDGYGPALREALAGALAAEGVDVAEHDIELLLRRGSVAVGR